MKLINILRLNILFLSLFFQLFADSSSRFEIKHIRPIMEHLLNAHVEVHDFSPLIVQRSFKKYIHDFDPSFQYLIQEEIDSYLNMHDEMIHRVINQFFEDKYIEYFNLNQLIEQSIIRNRMLRNQVMDELVQEPLEFMNQPVKSVVGGYSKDLKELSDRLYLYIKKAVYTYLVNHPHKVLDEGLLVKIFQKLERNIRSAEDGYLISNNTNTMTTHILKAMSSSLDAHTGYYSRQEAYDIRIALKKEFFGIGVVLDDDVDGVYIADVLQGGSAEKNGNVRVGDCIVSINGKNVVIASFQEVLELLSGEEGSVVSLQIKRKEINMRVDLVREKISMDHERVSVKHIPYPEGRVGVITVPSFYDNGDKISLEHDLKKAFQQLELHERLNGLVIDLRDNGGGFLHQAVKMCAMFINHGLIVVTKYGDGKMKYYRSGDDQQIFQGPVVVMISKASASASEIVAQTLQDYGVAIIVGDVNSYGKGSMQYQTITDSRSADFFKVTVGRYYTASGRSPQIEGVKSDIVVPTRLSPYRIGERYLEYPLRNDHLSHDLFDMLISRQRTFSQYTHPLYVPYLQPKETCWRQMIGRLIDNSQQRLMENQEFQLFLQLRNRPHKLLQGAFSDNQLKRLQDLPLEEGVNIVKDMCVLNEALNGF